MPPASCTSRLTLLERLESATRYELRLFSVIKSSQVKSNGGCQSASFGAHRWRERSGGQISAQPAPLDSPESGHHPPSRKRESDKKVHQRRATGDSTDASLDEVVARLSDLGYTAQKLPGPLLLATTGGNRQVPKLMPGLSRSVEVCRAVELSSLTLDAAVTWSQAGSVE